MDPRRTRLLCDNAKEVGAIHLKKAGAFPDFGDSKEPAARERSPRGVPAATRRMKTEVKYGHKLITGEMVDFNASGTAIVLNQKTAVVLKKGRQYGRRT